MVTMALPTPIDPTKFGRYPVSISETLLREDGPRKRRRINVQYNHRPKTLNNQYATVKPSKDGEANNYDLAIKSEEELGSYKYRGFQQPSESLALIFNAEKQSFTLDRIDTDFRFNLRSTPSNKDTASLASQYRQLTTGQPDEGTNGVTGPPEDEENPDDIPADPSNPYDYRHFLNRGGSASPEASVRSSPVPNHSFGSSPVIRASSPIKRPRSRTEPKKPSRQRDERFLSPHPREEADADNEESDNNELIIDMGDSEPRKKPWRSALGVLNEGDRRPISLRSAASSMSPSVRGESEDEKDDKSDHDIEEIDLGESGIDIVSQGAAGEEVITNGTGWDDDDEGMLARELEQAMEAQEAESEARDQPNGQQHAVVAAAESSEESEEE